MNFWRKDIEAETQSETRADVIIQKKRRKQDPQAKGLSAVSIGRRGARAIHQRNEDRHVLEGTMAKALVGGQEHEVKLLNLSSNGVMIGFDGEVEIGEQLRLVIDECAPITTAVRWMRRGRVGLEFVAETVIIAEAGVQDFIIKTIAREHENAGYKPAVNVGAEKRGADKRHPMVWLAKLLWKGGEATARLRNISSTGSMIALSVPADLERGAEVVLALHEVGTLRARVRWCADRQFGLEFLDPFDVSQMAGLACAELAPPDDAGGLAAPSYEDEPADDDFNSLRIRLGKVRNPHQPPDLRYGRLTLDEVYATLYPDGLPEGVGDDAAQGAPQEP